MAKRLPADLLEQVQAALRDHPAGLALREIEARLTGVASRRSLQRKLNGWHRKGLVRSVGIRRGHRYVLAPPLGPATATAAASARATPSSTDDDGVPLSTAGSELRAMVKRPMADRAPIGYQREFLDGYTPGTTQYLMESLRRHLHELGRTPDDQRPAGTYARDILNRLLIDSGGSGSSDRNLSGISGKIC